MVQPSNPKISGNESRNEQYSWIEFKRQRRSATRRDISVGWKKRSERGQEKTKGKKRLGRSPEI